MGVPLVAEENITRNRQRSGPTLNQRAYMSARALHERYSDVVHGQGGSRGLDENRSRVYFFVGFPLCS